MANIPSHFRIALTLIGALFTVILAPSINGQDRTVPIDPIPDLVQFRTRIEIKKSAFYLNGSIVKLPIPLTELEKYIGPPSRTFGAASYISIWDDHGLLAYQKDESSDINQLSVILNNLDMEIEFWPVSVFRGALIIDGVRIKSNNSNSYITRTKTGNKFKPVSPITPFLLEINSGRLQVIISRALKGDFNAAGNIVEVAIAIPEE